LRRRGARKIIGSSWDDAAGFGPKCLEQASELMWGSLDANSELWQPNSVESLRAIGKLMTKTPNSTENAGGQQSKNAPQQGDLRDEHQGTYDPVGDQKLPDTNRQTEHERAQPGADVRGDPVPTKNLDLPEGLKRQRMGPYSRDHGRGDVPAHVPQPGGTAGIKAPK
jgi:hypothetical protein